MITATVYFESGVNVGDIVNCLQGLPESIKPVYFAEDEGKVIKTNLLSDKKRFRDFQKDNQIGFFLYTKDQTHFDVSVHSVGYAETTISLENKESSELVIEFFKCLVQCNPIFGYACDESEYEHRNRYYITLGENHIESWIGRKLDKYISGVYWYTMLSNRLLEKHQINLFDLSEEATSCEALSDGSLHLLKFYERPEDWEQNAERLDSLCEKVNGVFSRRSVESAARGVSTYLAYDEIISNWR